MYRVHFSRAVRSFNALAGSQTTSLEFGRDRQSSLFHDYERGYFSTKFFLDSLRKAIGRPVSDKEVTDAWNSILLGVIPDRKALLEQLSQRYHVSILSNINALHHNHIKDECDWLFASVEERFLSYEMGMRKPDAIIFDEVLNRLEVAPEAALFIDDSLPNIEAARNFGINTLWLEKPDSLVQSLSTVLR